MCVHWLLTSVIQGHGFSEVEILLPYLSKEGAHSVVSRDQSCLQLVSCMVHL